MKTRNSYVSPELETFELQTESLFCDSTISIPIGGGNADPDNEVL